MLRPLITLLLSGQLVASAPQGASQPHAERAARLFEDGDFDAAADAFEAAFAQTGDAAFLYGAGVSRHEGGDCEAAVATLERFRATDPDPRDDEAAEQIIAQCEALEPSVVPSPRETARPEPATQTEDARPATLDRVSWGLLGGGAGLVVAGGVLYGSAYGVLRPRDRMESEFERDATRSRALSVSGIVVASVGAAVLVAGVARLLARRRGSASRTAALQR
ncbi:MAG: hypothetical protein ACE37F_11655 [Nannocystaceae bacterium]|nr:hypothetical protein [bacterium]